MRRIRRAGCLLLVLVLLPLAAMAGTIDDVIRLVTRPGEDAVAMEMQAEVLHMPEMGETRTEWINRLLKHIAFRMSAGGGIESETIEVDGRTAIGSISRTGKAGKEWQFSFDSGTAWRMANGGDLLSSLSGISADISALDYYSEILILMDGFYRFFEGLPAAFPEASAQSKTNTKYKPYGTAVKKWSIVLGDDVLQTEKMAEYLDSEGLEDVKKYLSGAVLAGRQRLTLLTDENDHLMKANYTAKAGLSEDDMRNVNLDWRCLRREEGYRDVMKLTTPGTGSRRDNLTITQEMVIDPEKGETYKGSIETDRVADRIHTRIVLTYDLTAADGTVSGEILEKTTVGGDVTSTGITVSLTRNAQDEYGGSLEIVTKLGKIEKERIRILLTAGKAEAPKWEEVPVKRAGDAEQELIAEKAAKAFLKALIPVPEEDLQYILADLPEGTWRRMIKIDESEETEQP